MRAEREVTKLVEVRRKERENPDSLIRRFSRKVQQSGLLLKARRIRYRETTKNKTRLKKDALRRVENQKQREYLRKIGKLKVTRFNTYK